MTDDLQMLEHLRGEVVALRRRVTELESHIALSTHVEGGLPVLQEPFEALFRASPVAVVITAMADERYLDVNEHFARITGYTRDEVLGRTSHELGIWANPDDRIRIGRLFLEHAVIRDVELTFRTKAHDLRTVIASLALVNWSGIPCVLTMCHDITERQQASLERERLLQEAHAALHLRDEFLSVAAHELNTPLTALQLSIQGIQRIARKGEIPDTLLDRLASKLNAADHNIERLAHLINELLDVTRLRKGKLTLQMEVVDLGQLVEVVVARFAEQFAQAQCEVVLDMRPSQLIRADRSRLDQIITNLLANALKYGPGQPIEIRVMSDVSSVRLQVRDHGIGIAPEDQHRIFGRFERAVSTSHYGGLGLGLYVVRQLVTALGGTIEVASEPGHGAAFTVTFPRYINQEDA